jgi:hypothetical protein
MDDWIPCLGVKAFGLCRYDPLRPHAVYFSIGEAIGALAFLLAFTQFVTPGLKFRLRVHRWSAYVALALFVVAVVYVGIAALIPALLGYVVAVIGFPIFWETLGGLCVISGASVLGYTYYFSRAAFSDANCKRFFYACHHLIMSGSEAALRALAEELPYSAKAIVSAAANGAPPHRAPGAKEEPQLPQSPYDYANALLAVLSDKRFCRVLVDSAPWTALEFLRTIASTRGLTRPGSSLVEQLIQQSFLSDNSMLHREEDFVGLGHFKSFTREVFGNYEFVAGTYRPLQAWRQWDDQFITNEGIEKYVRALKTALEAYYAYGDFQQYPSAIYVGFDHLVEVVTFRIQELGPAGAPYKASGVFGVATVERTLTELVRMVEENTACLPRYAFDAASYDSFKDPSIYGIAADAIFKFLETLATKFGDDERIRDLAIGLWMEVDPTPHERASPAIIEIQKRLLVHLTKKLNDNLDKGYYPMVVRVLIMLIGVWDSTKKDPATLGFATAELHEQLRKKYAAAYAADQEKAARMLPAGVTFESSTNELVSVNKYTKTTNRLALEPDKDA